jgi:hypothetical protein
MLGPHSAKSGESYNGADLRTSDFQSEMDHPEPSSGPKWHATMQKDGNTRRNQQAVPSLFHLIYRRELGGADSTGFSTFQVGNWTLRDQTTGTWESFLPGKLGAGFQFAPYARRLRVVSSLHGHTGCVNTVTWSHNGQRILSGSGKLIAFLP